MNATFGKDVVYALRSLRRTPLFTAAAVLSLALGIGANTAIYSLIDQVLLRALPVREPERLVIVHSPGYRNGLVWSDENDGRAAFSYPMYRDLRDKAESLSGLLARFGFDASFVFNGKTQRGSGEMVSGNYFDVLGVRPALGRLLAPEDDAAAGMSSVAVLSHDFWLKHFAGRGDVLNQQISINGRSMTVVGVTARGFYGVQLGYRPDAFVSITLKPQMTPNWNGLDSHRDYWLNIMGRLKPGVSVAQAQAQLQSVYLPLLQAEADEQFRSASARERYTAKPIILEAGGAGRRLLRSETRQPLLALMAMVGLVLLIACANVANLLVARGTARERETAVRLAIGASRGRLVRQCLIESVILALAAGVAGLVVAQWTLSGLLAFVPEQSGTRALSASLDGRVLLFSSLLSIATGIVFGLVPAFETTRPDVATGLKAGTASLSAFRHARIRKLLVIAQVAFTLLMLVGAGLFGKTLLKMKAIDVGLKSENVIRFRIAPDLNGYTSEQSRNLYRRLHSALLEVPGVANASLATIPVFADTDSGSNVTVEGYTANRDEDMNLAQNEVGPRYFATLGIPLVAGREFNEGDNLSDPKVCLINEATAARFFKDRNPIGYHIAFGGGNTVVPDMTIVGVVKNSMHSRVGEEMKRFIYTPYLQKKNLNQMTFYIRSGMEPTAVMNGLQNKVRELEPALPVSDMKTLETQIDESLSDKRMMTLFSLAFGLLSVALAGFGVYGVMSYLVSRRAREIGIRIAVGAPLSSVRWLIMKEILVMTALGTVIGLPLALALGRAAQSLLYGMTGMDLQVTLLALAAILLLALAGGYIPARRATRVDPVTALRNE
jgi:putative ABC transport system permease protein